MFKDMKKREKIIARRVSILIIIKVCSVNTVIVTESGINTKKKKKKKKLIFYPNLLKHLDPYRALLYRFIDRELY